MCKPVEGLALYDQWLDEEMTLHHGILCIRRIKGLEQYSLGCDPVYPSKELIKFLELVQIPVLLYSIFDISSTIIGFKSFYFVYFVTNFLFFSTVNIRITPERQ